MMQSDARDHDDDLLLDELRAALTAHDPVPAAVRLGAEAAFELRDLDAQLAELLGDTASQEGALAGVRGDGGRLLTFGAGERFIEVECSGTGDARDLEGYVVPAAGGEILAEQPGAEPRRAPLDDGGRFRLAGVPRGPLRLRVLVTGLAPMVTPWTAV